MSLALDPRFREGDDVVFQAKNEPKSVIKIRG
jgi:hypothetical protein